MDAEAYKEASRSIVQILWDVGCSNCSTVDFLWKKARITAFEAMNYFEVSICRCCVPFIGIQTCLTISVVCVCICVSECVCVCVF